MVQQNDSDDEPSPGPSIQPAVYTHQRVDKVIRGLLIRTSMKLEGAHTVVGALQAEAEHNWFDVGDEHCSCLELGFDLKRRPAWIRQKSSINYLGLGLKVPAVPASEMQTGEVRVQHCDWTRDVDLRHRWGSPIPPDWVILVDVLDHLSDSTELLRAVGNLYDGKKTGHALVVTRNARFFGREFVSPETEAACLLTSRRMMRRQFRDAGFQIVDEASLPLEDSATPASTVSEMEARGQLLSLAPVHMWVLRLHRTRTEDVSQEYVSKWLEELDKQDADLQKRRCSQPSEATSNHFKPPPVPFRYEPARLILRSILDDLRGVHRRELDAHEPLLTARNAGGRLYIVRRGRLATRRANVTDSSPQPQLDIRHTFRPGDVVGEMEVFDEDGTSDRLFMWSLYALPQGVEAGTTTGRKTPFEALVIPAHTATRLLRRPDVLGNPLFMRLRAKSLESELTIQRQSSSRGDLVKQVTDQDGKTTQVQLNSTERDDLLRFKTKWGSSRTQALSAVQQTACLFELALELDRSAGVLPASDRRLVVFANFTAARARLFGDDSDKTAAKTNAAVQFLEVCGVLRPLFVNTQLPMNFVLDGLDAAQKARVRDVATTYFKRVRAQAIKTFVTEGLCEKFSPNDPRAAKVQFSKFLERSHSYIGAIVESDFLLRRFSMDLNVDLLKEMKFLRESRDRDLKRANLTQAERWAAANQEDRIEPWDEELTRRLIRFVSRRIDAGLGGFDSLGMRWQTAA